MEAKKRKLFYGLAFTAFAFICLLLLLPPDPAVVSSGADKASVPETAQEHDCARIVSLAPSITEILFELDLGDNVVGVTMFCDYPPEVEGIPQIGGYYDPNFEALVAVRPSLVIALPEHMKDKQMFDKFGLSTLLLDHDNVFNVLDSISKIGQACDRKDKAENIVNEIRARMEEIKVKSEGLNRPKVMVTVGRNMGGGSISDIHIAGKEGFFTKLVEAAGGVNVYQEGDLVFPKISAEGIVFLGPEVIFDMIPSLDQKLDEEKVLKDWAAFSSVPAVQNERVHVFQDVYAVRPGPRFILILSEMARKIHPEIDWDEKSY
jgi:cobalamin transport system substrate-binding protein